MWSYKHVIEREHPSESLVNMNNFIVIYLNNMTNCFILFNYGMIQHKIDYRARHICNQRRSDCQLFFLKKNVRVEYD